MRPGVAARVAAAELVNRVMEAGAYSNVLSRRLADEHPPDVAAHAQRIALDALRLVRVVDDAVERAAGRPVTALDPAVRSVLRVAGAELASGAAAHAAVDTAVDAVRELGAGRARGFVNGVLRRLAERPPVVSADATTPPWVMQQLSDAWGDERAQAFFTASLQVPLPAIRARRADVSYEPTGIDGAGYVEGAALNALIADGAAMVADPASTAVGLAVGALPGEVVLDMAAAPGGKTSHLWDQMGGTGTLIAADRHARRLAAARRRLRHAGIAPHWVVADGRRPPFSDAVFDRVLVDAPCTGAGTIRRRPEILHRLEPDGPSRMAALQQQLLDAALRVVKPTGSVVYSVCTVFPEETVDIVADLDARPPGGLPGEQWGRGLLLAPHITGTDGMFISVINPTGRPGG